MSEDGQYWAPDENGEWVWMDEAAARESMAAMQREGGQREEEAAAFEAESERIIEETQARNRARDVFDWTRVGEQFEEVFRSVTGAGGTTP